VTDARLRGAHRRAQKIEAETFVSRSHCIRDYLALRDKHPDWFANPAGGVQLVQDPERITAIENEVGDRYRQRGLPSEWSEVGIRYQDPYLLVLRDAITFPDESTGVHHRVVRWRPNPAGVAVLAMYAGRILLLRHFRHPTRQWHWEIPRGGIEPGRSKQERVMWELREEAQAQASDIIELGVLHGATGLMAASVVLFAARLTSIGAPALNEGITETRLVSSREFEDMVRNSEITDSFSVACYFHARLRGLL
jgi:ADP-ribose pyrophosphatase